MGRTNPTYRDALRGLEERWAPYRRALRRADRAHFDRLFEHARAHADAGGYLDHRFVEVPLLVSVDLRQQRRLADLDRRLDERDEHLAAVDRRLAALERRLAELDRRLAALDAGDAD